jgi:hypothetical protein
VLNRIEQLKHTQYLSVGLVFLLLLMVTPVAAQTADAGAKSYSGDDAYDPAAGGLPALSVVVVPQRIIRSSASTLSGDDAYDPAAGGLPALSVVGLIRSSGSAIACAPSVGELEARSTRSVDGGFSGDDAYDPAAGGIPEVSLLTIGLDLVACAPAASEN